MGQKAIIQNGKFSLKWNDFQTNVSSSFSKLRTESDFFDVTLVSDDEVHISSHKVVLSASSDFFKNILRKSSHSSPLIYLSGIKSKELNFVMDYIYDGAVQIYQADLDSFLDIAKRLQIDGLEGSQIDGSQIQEKEDNNSESEDFISNSYIKEEYTAEDNIEEVQSSPEQPSSETKPR